MKNHYYILDRAFTTQTPAGTVTGHDCFIYRNRDLVSGPHRKHLAERKLEAAAKAEDPNAVRVQLPADAETVGTAIAEGEQLWQLCWEVK